MCGVCPYLGYKYFCYGCFQATNKMTTGLGRGADWGPWGARGTLLGTRHPWGSGTRGERRSCSMRSGGAS